MLSDGAVSNAVEFVRRVAAEERQMEEKKQQSRVVVVQGGVSEEQPSAASLARNEVAGKDEEVSSSRPSYLGLFSEFMVSLPSSC